MSIASGVLAAAHLVFFGVVEPSLVLRKIARARRSPVVATTAVRTTVPRMKDAVTMILIRGSISVAAAIGIPVSVFAASWPSGSGLAIAAGACLAMIAIEMIHCYWGVTHGKPFIQRQCPRTREEKLWWCALSLAAGTTEELTWRGVQVSILYGLTGSAGIAVAICCLTFAIGHIGYGLRWFFVVLGFAATFQWIVWTTGSLYPAMIIHTLVNVVGGLYTARLARTLGHAELLEPATHP